MWVNLLLWQTINCIKWQTLMQLLLLVTFIYIKLWHNFSIFFSSEMCHLSHVFFTSKICCFFSCVCFSVFVSRVVLFLCVLFLLCYFSVFCFSCMFFAQEKCGLYLVCFPLQYICITSHVFYITDKTVEAKCKKLSLFKIGPHHFTLSYGVTQI